MNNITLAAVILPSVAAATDISTTRELVPRPPIDLPPPIVVVADTRTDEKPVNVEMTESDIEENVFFARRRACFTFTNPNARVMSGEFEFPIPEGAFVCGYSLEINGTMVPGVVCEKEKARVAFETEVKKGIDPGIVEHVKGNIWKTRIFPLTPKTPRRAEVEYVVQKPVAEGASAVCERDGDDVFVASPADAAKPESIADKVASFYKGTILWDASGSAASKSASWRKLLESLPETGEWRLVTFSNEPDGSTHTTRASLLAAVDSVAYDGGTDIAKAVDCAQKAGGSAALLFSDEMDTLGSGAAGYEDIPGLVVASRPDAPPRRVKVRKLTPGEAAPEGAEIAEGKLLATVWAAERVSDLASQAENRREEFLALGRRYGVASPVTSLIVLETLEQYLTHKIEPPAAMSFHDEWVRRRRAEDDAIADKKAQTQHESDLLSLWEERIKWWNDPKPKNPTPKSGLFDTIVEGAAEIAGNIMGSAHESRRANRVMALHEMADEDGMAERMPMAAEPAAAKSSGRSELPAGAAGSEISPTVTLKPWKADTPYMKSLEKASKDGPATAYAAYLKLKGEYGSSPAFFMDAAGVFFGMSKNRDDEPFRLGVRIVTNMAEFKLEDAAVWRAMGWRLREAGAYESAILCFRKALALRGEEGQSRRDLALVLAEYGKSEKDARALSEAMSLLKEAAFTNWSRRSGRRTNDRQVSIVSLEELNALISWCEGSGVKADIPQIDAAYRRDIPLKLRIVMSWDADETDIDLHVLEPDGEEAYYGHRRTASGGFVSEDVTTGYGPEEYLRKDLEAGKYKVMSNYFASHQTALTGPATVTATVYTDWGTAQEKMQIMTLRLEKPKSRHLIGEVKLQ